MYFTSDTSHDQNCCLTNNVNPVTILTTSTYSMLMFIYKYTSFTKYSTIIRKNFLFSTQKMCMCHQCSVRREYEFRRSTS